METIKAAWLEKWDLLIHYKNTHTERGYQSQWTTSASSQYTRLALHCQEEQNCRNHTNGLKTTLCEFSYEQKQRPKKFESPGYGQARTGRPYGKTFRPPRCLKEPNRYGTDLYMP